MPRRIILMATAAVFVTACASTPPADPARALPHTAAAWSAGPGVPGGQVQDWVSAFGDPALSTLVDEALTANNDLAAAAARLDAARAVARAAGAARVPSLDASFDAVRRDTRFAGSNEFGIGLSTSWEADVWGRVSDRARAGALDAEAAASDFRGAQLSIAGQVAKAWFALTEARLQAELAERELDTRARSLQLVQRRYEGGLARSSDVRTARSALASSEASLAARRRALAAAARGLETLLGRYPSGALASASSLPDMASLQGLGAPGDLLARRPDLIAAERRLQSAGLRADDARKALLPRLTLTGAGGMGGADLEDIFDTDSLLTRLTAGLTAPIFRGGALRAERDRTAAVAREQLAAYVNRALTAWREAEDAIYADGALAARADALSHAYEEAAAAETLVERQYAQGLATIFELLDAQTRRINAESLLIGARRERAANRVDLYLAIAGDFRTPPTAAEGED
ncbi:MAG: efflux transporter outer membrane subunit [Maricaulaceae bacterium]|nr:efflux transporter outer membrane subunit [Maricaulaceae bacterium]